MPLELHEAPDLDAVRADIGLDLSGHLADSGEVDAEQLCALLERRRERPAKVRVACFPRPHVRSVVEREFEYEMRTDRSGGK